MKSFFQEYGGTIIASLVVVCLIAVCTVIKPLAAESHVSIVDKLSNYVEETLDNASENDLNSVLGNSEQSTSSDPAATLCTFELSTANMGIAYINGEELNDEARNSVTKTINSSYSFNYEEGMDWETFVESKYNTGFTVTWSYDEYSSTFDDYSGETIWNSTGVTITKVSKFEFVKVDGDIRLKETIISATRSDSQAYTGDYGVGTTQTSNWNTVATYTHDEFQDVVSVSPTDLIDGANENYHLSMDY